MKNNYMKVLSLFDGISCGRVALDKLGVDVDTYIACEIKPEAIQVSKFNYPDIIQAGSVENMGVQWLVDNSYDLFQVDLLIGGSPCQSFSNAGNKEGFDGKSKLFYEFIRVLKEVKPRYFLLENVKMKKEWQDIITNTLKEIYPETQVYNINSKLVSAQLRNRFYWTNIQGVKQPGDKNITLQSILESGFTDRDKARAILESESRPLKTKSKMWHRYKNAGFTTIVHENSIDDIENIRYFTQTELERLQTLPDGYTSILSKNKAAGCIGDGWTVDVITHILSYIKHETNNR